MKYLYLFPLFDERKCAHRFSYCLKKAFKKNGLTLRRCDYQGTGEANGNFSDVTLKSLQEDINSWVVEENISLIGLRFGADLALLHCAKNNKKIKNLILLQPIVNGSEYIDYLYRKQHLKNLMTGKPKAAFHNKNYQNIEGYKTNLNLINQINKLNLLKISGNCSAKNICIFQISNYKRINPSINALAHSLKIIKCNMKIQQVKLPAFWERIPVIDYGELTKKILEACSD